MPISRLLIAGIAALMITACGQPAPSEQGPETYTDANGIIVTKVRNAEEAAAAPIGRLVFIDPASGEQRDPTAEELEAMRSAQAKAAIPGQPRPLQTYETKDGTIGAPLGREYWHQHRMTVPGARGAPADAPDAGETP